MRICDQKHQRARAKSVLGLDVSLEQLEVSRREVPKAHFAFLAPWRHGVQGRCRDLVPTEVHLALGHGGNMA